MKCVLNSTIVLLPLITIGIFYFCNFGGFSSGKPENENIFECRKQMLSCIKIANQLINELQVEEFDTEAFQNLQDKYSQDGKVTSNIECQDDLSFCKTKTIETIADALQVKFYFNCTSNLKEGEQREHHCDEWDYFDLYVHCDAKGNEHLLPHEHVWEEDKCKLMKDTNVQCDTRCVWMHEVNRSSRLVKRQAIFADSPTPPPPPPTTTTTTTTPAPSTIPSTTETSTFPPTVSMASISRPPTITMAVPTMNPSTTEVTTAAVTTPTMASNTAIPTIPATGSTSKPKRRIPAHCLRKPVGTPPGPITTTSTPSTMTGTGSTTTPSTMTGAGSTTTPTNMTGTGSTTTPSTMTGTGSTSTPSTMTGTGSTTTPSTVTGTGSTTTPSTVTGTGSTTTPSTINGTGSTITTPSIMTGTRPTSTTPSTMTGTGSATTPSTMTGSTATIPSTINETTNTALPIPGTESTSPSTMTGTEPTTATASNTTGITTSTPKSSSTTITTTTTKAQPPPPPPPPAPAPPRPPPPPACTSECLGFGLHQGCDGFCFTCIRAGSSFRIHIRCLNRRPRYP